MPAKIVLAGAMLAVLGLLLAACGPAQPTAAPGTLVKSDKARSPGLAALANDVNALAKGNADFALALYQQLRGKAAGNFMFSPHSITTALAMTYAGARGATATEMARSLRYNLPPPQLHPAFNTLDQELASRGKGAQGKDGKGFRLNLVNAIWGQTGFKFQPEFLDTLAQNYGAGLRLLDFQKNPEPSRLVINQWVADQTEQRIKDLLPKGIIDASTALVLTNAIYFNAAWSDQFDKKATKDEEFNMLDGKSLSVPMMHRSGSYGYADGDGWQALELPYDGRELSMVVLLPAAGKFAAYESALNAAQLETTLGALKSRQVAVSLPRWKVESSFSLREPMEALGMRDAFVPRTADFSGMDGTRDLYVSAIQHKTFVAVDEAGTEAAAATAVVIGVTAMPGEPAIFKADRPFIYLIRDLKTGEVLFLGRVINPA